MAVFTVYLAVAPTVVIFMVKIISFVIKGWREAKDQCSFELGKLFSCNCSLRSKIRVGLSVADITYHESPKDSIREHIPLLSETFASRVVLVDNVFTFLSFHPRKGARKGS